MIFLTINLSYGRIFIMIINSAEEMVRLGERVGRLISGSTTLELVGDIGAGKTTFVKGLARGMGITETAQSPTFTLSRVYQAPKGLELRHYDFYRLTDSGILQDELSEVFTLDNVVVVVEWASTVGATLPDDRLRLAITVTGELTREIELSGLGPESAKFLESLK